jgi:uncharacterized repeat protein (TIGR02543 family)
VDKGAFIQLSVTPSGGYTFSGWSGDITGTSAQSFGMEKDMTITANFTATGTTDPTDPPSGGDDGVCKSADYGALFCRYEPYNGSTGGCYALNSKYDEDGRSCSALISACETDGALYYGVNSSALTAANEYGKGVSCSENGGTAISTPGTDPGIKKYCCWPVNGTEGGCHEIGGTYSDAATKTEASCEANGGVVQTNNTPPTVSVFCGWGSADKCYPMSNPDGNDPDNKGMTYLQACNEYGTVYNSMEACQTGETNKVVTYCLWDKCYPINNPNGESSDNPKLTNLQNCITNSESKTAYSDDQCTTPVSQ